MAPASAVTAGIATCVASQPRGMKAPCSVTAFIARVHTRSESGAFDVP